MRSLLTRRRGGASLCFVGRVVTVIVALLVGCGGGSAGIALEDLAGELQRRGCERGVACGEYPDIATCEASELVEDANLLTTIDAVARGTITYDPDLAQACLDQFYSPGCLYVRTSEACDRTFEGRVAVGGVCLLSEECGGSGTCVRDAACSGIACCPGTCAAAHIPLGSICDSSIPCVAGGFCRNGVCVARLPQGAACSGSDCLPPNLCDSTGVCNPLPSQGEPCETQSICGRRDNFCETTTLTCARRKTPGAACVAALECVSYADCISGLCTARPGPGQVCEPATFCLGDLECRENVCIPPAPETACPAPLALQGPAGR